MPSIRITSRSHHAPISNRSAEVRRAILVVALAATVLVVAMSVWPSPGSGAEPVAAAGIEIAAVEPPAAPVAVTVAAADPVPDVSVEQVAVRFWPDITLVGASDDERAAVALAVSRFRNAGLALPDVTIEFRDDMEGCGGHFGLFQTRYTPWRILVCSDAPFVVTHELAHAWEAANLGDPDRARYVDERSLETWDGSDVAWDDRGVEDAAFHVQQNLMPRHVDLESPTWQERTAAYTTLTGRRSPMFDALAAGAAPQRPAQVAGGPVWR